uniref:spidroin-2-like isoform X5 n=1 Tax=Myxine glutinosa TaxID=7769 RepID=UPI00358F659D
MIWVTLCCVCVLLVPASFKGVPNGYGGARNGGYGGYNGGYRARPRPMYPAGGGLNGRGYGQRPGGLAVAASSKGVGRAGPGAQAYANGAYANGRGAPAGYGAGAAKPGAGPAAQAYGGYANGYGGPAGYGAGAKAGAGPAAQAYGGYGNGYGGPAGYGAGAAKARAGAAPQAYGGYGNGHGAPAGYGAGGPMAGAGPAAHGGGAGAKAGAGPAAYGPGAGAGAKAGAAPAAQVYANGGYGNGLGGPAGGYGAGVGRPGVGDADKAQPQAFGGDGVYPGGYGAQDGYGEALQPIAAAFRAPISRGQAINGHGGAPVAGYGNGMGVPSYAGAGGKPSYGGAGGYAPAQTAGGAYANGYARRMPFSPQGPGARKRCRNGGAGGFGRPVANGFRPASDPYGAGRGKNGAPCMGPGCGAANGPVPGGMKGYGKK